MNSGRSGCSRASAIRVVLPSAFAHAKSPWNLSFRTNHLIPWEYRKPARKRALAGGLSIHDGQTASMPKATPHNRQAQVCHGNSCRQPRHRFVAACALAWQSKHCGGNKRSNGQKRFVTQLVPSFESESKVCSMLAGSPRGNWLESSFSGG